MLITARVQPLLGVSSGDKGIGYGGVDTGGSKEPGARYHNNLWDDEEDW